MYVLLINKEGEGGGGKYICDSKIKEYHETLKHSNKLRSPTQLLQDFFPVLTGQT